MAEEKGSVVQETEVMIPKHTEKKTQHEIFLQRKKDDLKKKAQHHWALLRQSVRSVIKAVEEADQKEFEIYHGIHIDRKLNHQHEISQVLYIPEHKEYLTCDGQNLYIFHEDGQKKGSVPTPEKMNRVTYSTQTNQFVGWLYGQENLYLMTRDFVIKSQSRAVGRILMSAYNHNTGELITVGPHFITCWTFRYGARYLIPRTTTTTNFGETNMFKTLVLEETASQAQRIFFAQGNGVVVFNARSGAEVAHKKELHTQPVTALTFYNVLKYVITGAVDGCIKVWDTDWKIKMVFVGHSDQVNFLKIYCHGPAFISASLDCTLRLWNMDTCDEVDKTLISEPIEGMGTQMNYDIFYTYAGKKVDLWRLQHLYHIHTNIGSRVQSIKVTSHPFFPQRAIVLCRDSSVRIVCPSNGEVITTLLMKQTEGLIDAVYAIAEDTIFTVMSNGDIVKGRAYQNPCEVVSRWKCSSPQENCNCLLVYEYVVDPTASSDVWTLTKPKIPVSRSHMGVRQQSSKNRTLLLGGQKDGYICVFDWYTGEVTFKAEAHGSKGVLSMVANSRSDQLVTSGNDSVIKIWRLYPFAQEALTPLMSFYCAHCPSFMTTIKTSLGVAFQDPSTATFSVVLYSLSDKNRFDHKPDDDHMDMITGFTSCPRMKLYASSSIDGTICIWSENNTLLRLLHLNTAIHSIAFCSPQGDLLAGIDNHLFHIPHSKFLPKSYKRKQVCMKFLPVKTEQPLAYDENSINVMDKSDVKRLKNSHASFKHAPVTDILPLEEQEEIVRERNIKEEALKMLELRENEIMQIKDGALKAQHKPKTTRRSQNTAFREYMKMYYNKEREKLPLFYEYPDDVLQKQLAGEPLPVKEEYRPEEGPLGFFSELGQKLLEEDPPSLLHQCYPSAPSGFLPNSVLIKILYPPPVPKKVPWETIPYHPPELTSKQLAEIRGIYKKQGTFANDDDDDSYLSRVLEMDLTDEDANVGRKRDSVLSDESLRSKLNSGAGKAMTLSTSAKPSEAKTQTVSELSVSKIAKKDRRSNRKKTNVYVGDVDNNEEEDDAMFSQPGLSTKSSLMSKLQNIITKPPAEREHTTDDPKPATPSKAIKRPSPALTKPIVKLISRSETKTQATPRVSPTPPPSITPLPSFIKQFVTVEWFIKYFPNCNENTMPKPWTSDTFVNMISKLLRIAEWIDRVRVTDTILCVYTEEGLSESVTLSVARTLVAVLNDHTSPPVCSVAEQKAFILSALRTLAALVVKEKEVIAEIMVQFLVGDKDVRSCVLDAMTNLGLVDPHRQFQKELDSWDIWNIDEKNLRNGLHNKCDQWLERWMTSYKLRIKDSMHLLNQGHSLQGHVSNIRSVSGGLSKVGVKNGHKENVTSSHSRVTSSVRTGQAPFVTESSVTVTLDSLQSLSILESVNYLDVVTYFCEIMTEKELEALKRGALLRGKQENRVVQAKNTVLVLPRISQKPALVRLGEMHTSHCRPERETALHTGFRMPPMAVGGKHATPGDLSKFVSCINLPLKTVYLNPFISDSEERIAHLNQPVLITLKLSQKYFIPSLSYVPIEGHVALMS